ncbi:MAG: glycosyltransferase family A protein [Sphingomicrobium sp.]
MTVKYSIITTCMGRLDHLKQTLRRMLEQPDSEVIVVDWSCPQDTAGHVAKHFPAARVVKVEGQGVFSNWAARNAGAAQATGEFVVFCDADTMLRPDALEWIGARLPPRAYGHFERNATSQFNTTNLRLGFNQLRGFHVLQRAIFDRFGGYDDVLAGYAAGADTDLETRLSIFGFKRFVLDPAIIEQVVEHGNEDRFRNHKIPIKTSYAAGYLYRKAKTVLIRIRRRPNLPRPFRQKLYAAALKAAHQLSGDNPSTSFKVGLEKEPIGMPLQLGFRKAEFSMSIDVSISGTDPVDEIPALVNEAPRRRR